MWRLWPAAALALMAFSSAAPPAAAETSHQDERTPVAAGMASIGSHRLAVIAVGDSVFGVIVDDRMYARSFRGDVRQLEVILVRPRTPQPSDYFTLYFNGGNDDCAVTMTTPRSGTGMFVARARVWSDS